MLVHLSVRDFAIIESLDLNFGPGFSVITGETGAGKSIIIEAISLALGSRADTTYVRTGKNKASIELTVLSSDPSVLAELADNEINTDGPILITREIFTSGKSVCRINGTVVNVSYLNSLCKKLCDIHGQYEHQSLLNPDNHLAFLDAFGGNRLTAPKERVAALYDSYTSVQSKIRAWEKTRQESLRKHDFMRYEKNEIEAANPLPGEDSELETELSLLQNGEKIYRNLTAAQTMLADDEGDASSRLSEAASLLSELAPYSPALSGLSNEIDALSDRLTDLTRSIRREAEAVSYSEERLNEIQERLEVLTLLKKKYGPTLSDVIAYCEKIRSELGILEGSDEDAAKWKEQCKQLENELFAASCELSKARKTIAKELETAVTNELKELNFVHATFAASFEAAATGYSANGIDQMEFLISANKGEDPKPLARIASGGELSRIMLAFKRIVADTDHIPSMIFDEIDNGISGITASVVGRKLKQLSERHQIVCITHLPQIAACGDEHFRIEKRDDEEHTISTVVPLDFNGRVMEIARLTGGINITESTLKAAEELLLSSKES